MRRQRSFIPSFALSAILNVALFAVLQPIHVEAGRTTAGGYRLQRLHRVTVDAQPTQPTPAPAPVTTAQPVAEPRPRQAVRPVERVAVAERRTRAVRRGGDGRPRTERPAVQMGPPAPLPAMGPTGGDGTRLTPTEPLAGGGDLIAARPSDAGDPRLTGAAGPALGDVPLTREPPRRVAQVRDGPPLLLGGLGDRGGVPSGPSLGRDPLPGTAGSGDVPTSLAPRTLEGFQAPLAPTTPGPRLRPKAGPGLPLQADSPLAIAAMPVDAAGRSGGGGGTAATPSIGGGGPPLIAGAERVPARGGGGSGLSTGGPRPGGLEIGPGPGGSGGGGNGLAPVGAGLDGGGNGLRPVATPGAPSLVSRVAPGDGATPARPGKRAPGPGGAPVALAPEPTREREPGDASGPGRRGGHGGGDGPGRGPGQGPGHGDGKAAATASTRSKAAGEGYTGVVVDTLGVRWHHYPSSFDFRVGSVDGPLLASVGVIRYPSVAAAEASSRVRLNGRREVLVIRPLAIEYVARDGEGARQRVVISAADAARLRESGLLKQRSRILTVYKNNY